VIDIAGVDLVKFAQKAYELSVPQGMGFLHFTPAPLAEEDAKEIVERSSHGNVRLSMDYVAGRACKMVVWEKDGKLQIRDSWYDHTDDQLRKLLEAFDLKLETASEHGCACNSASMQNAQLALEL
jgi:hypothetical protein